MKFKSYSTIIFAFNLLFLATTLFLYYKLGGKWYIAILPFAIISIALLVLKTPIDRYFFKFQEVGIDEKIYKMLRIEYPEIAKYSIEETKSFIQRMFYFLYAREAYIITDETEKLELYHTAIICAPAVIMSMNKTPDEAEDINRIAAYRHAFPSPKMQFIHSAEYDAEDGVMIVSLEQMNASLRQKEPTYHILYHIWSERYLLKNPGFPMLPDTFKNNLSRVFGFSKDKIDKILGYEVTNWNAIALTSFFTSPDSLKREFPAFYNEIDSYTRG